MSTAKTTLGDCPRHLAAHAELWRADPRAAQRAWFREAGFGLFIHYGLYSQRGRGEWTMFHDRIPVAEYERLAKTFRPDRFDAGAIADLAVEAGMAYVNLTTCHHDGFCLWDSATEPFNSMQACGRDLVAEMAVACAQRGLGFFAYFTHLLNWRHPWALGRDRLGMARPDYATPEPRYRLTRPEEWSRYWEWSHACLRELCALPQPLAGIWLDLIMGYYLQPDLVPIRATYDLIRAARPEALLSFKQGATGDEDYAAPEFRFAALADRVREHGGTPAQVRLAEEVWEQNRTKHNEICMTLQHQGWGYKADSPHHDADALWGALAYARSHGCNLLANVGPLPDGSLHPEDVATLREVGRRRRAQGWPDPREARIPGAKAHAGGA
jgi:alpha-L-fucosidase